MEILAFQNSTLRNSTIEPHFPVRCRIDRWEQIAAEFILFFFLLAGWLCSHCTVDLSWTVVCLKASMGTEWTLFLREICQTVRLRHPCTALFPPLTSTPCRQRRSMWNRNFGCWAKNGIREKEKSPRNRKYGRWTKNRIKEQRKSPRRSRKWERVETGEREGYKNPSRAEVWGKCEKRTEGSKRWEK